MGKFRMMELALVTTGLLQLGQLGMTFGVNSVKAADPSPAFPVRVPRAYFQENTLQGSLNVQSSQSKFNLNQNSTIDWTEEDKEQPAPKANALAVFQDQIGCAHFHELNGLSVCFLMMGDVESLGVNKRETSLQGVDDYISENLSRNLSAKTPCPVIVTGLEFQQASRQDNELLLTYKGVATPAPGCPDQKQEGLNIQMKLTVSEKV